MVCILDRFVDQQQLGAESVGRNSQATRYVSSLNTAQRLPTSLLANKISHENQTSPGHTEVKLIGFLICKAGLRLQGLIL